MTQTPLPASLLVGGRRFSDPQLSPDGETVSLIANAGGDISLVLVPSNGGVERSLPLEPAIASSRGGGHAWLPDGTGIVYAGNDGKVHVFDFATWQCRTITPLKDKVSALAVSPDGRNVAYVSDMRDIAVVSLIGHHWPVRMTTDADFAWDPCWSPDSMWLVWQEWDVPNMPWDGSRLVVRKSDGSEDARIIAGGDGICAQQPRFSPDGSQLSFLSDERGYLNVWVMNGWSFDDAKPLFEEHIDHGEPQWGPSQRSYVWTDGGDAMFVTRNNGGRGVLTKRRLHDGAVIGERSGTFTSLHSVKDRLVGVVADVDRATEVEVLHHSGAVTVARGPNLGIEDHAVVPEHVSWESSDGVTVPGRLYRASSDPAALVVWVHGGPTSQSQATFYPRWKYLLDRGWSVLVVDYRGTNGYGRMHQQALQGRWGEVDVQDVVSGIHAAIRNGWADSSQIALVGGSAAGVTILLALAQNPDLVQAAVVSYPVCDLFALARETWRFEAHYLDGIVGPLPEAYDRYTERSPITHADKISTPLLVLHGDDDEVVPLAQSTQLVDAIKRRGGVAEQKVYEGEGHGWRKPSTMADELERTVDFLAQHVLHLARQ
jgi:dipeptidyl aminopeptidase/acylaminoacyl peptidase